MLNAGLDLSRKRLDFHLLDGKDSTVEVSDHAPIRAAIESMNANPRTGTAETPAHG